MHLSLALNFLIGWACCVCAAPSPSNVLARNLFLPVNAADNGSYSSTHLNTTVNKTHTFHVPNTYISIVYEDKARPRERFEFTVLIAIIDDALDEVTRRVKRFGNVALPEDQDPYVYGVLAAPAPKGGWISIQSPDQGPAHGRLLTWGNVRDVLLGLQEIMVKGGKGMTSMLQFQIWLDNLGIIGWGEVTPGLLPTSLSLGGGIDAVA